MTTATPPPVWRVTGQAQVQDVSPQGQFVDGLRVSFVTGAGHPGSVFLPLAAATADNVRAAIDERAAEMEAIAGLSSGA